MKMAGAALVLVAGLGVAGLLTAGRLFEGPEGTAGSSTGTASAADVAATATRPAAFHRAGQTFVTWRETDAVPDRLTFSELAALKKRLGNVAYRVYRSTAPIADLSQAELVGEVGPLSVWNGGYRGLYPPADAEVPRYAIRDGAQPLAVGTGLFVHRPATSGPAFYAVVLRGAERAWTSDTGATADPVLEAHGPGVPVFQRQERRDVFQYVERPSTLRFFVRWEPVPHAASGDRPYDYLVAIPEGVRYPAPVGIHTHEWGGTQSNGYGWWFNAEKGSILLSSTADPYDWWTGYHEKYWEGLNERTAKDGVVRPYSQRRLLGFVDWLSTEMKLDLTRVHAGGNSMGASGAIMLAIRYPDRVAWAIGWVGIHIPRLSPQFRSSYELVYGHPDWNVKYEDGTPVWDYFDNEWYLRQHPERAIGFVSFSNGRNDSAIGWEQAVRFFKALQDTRQPHTFVWGDAGHNQRALMPAGGGERINPIDMRIDQSLPAFTRGSLDDDPGNGDPAVGDIQGQANRWLTWNTETVVDTSDRWAMTVALVEAAPAGSTTVDVTPRRLQQLTVRPGETFRWTSTSAGRVVQQGEVTADRWGLITLPQVIVTKTGSRLEVMR